MGTLAVGEIRKFKHSTITRDEDDILVITHDLKQTLDLEVFQQQAQAWADACPDEKGYSMVLINSCRTTPEGRKYIATAPGMKRLAALALVVGSRFGAMMANMFLRVNKPPIDARVFADEGEARAWLQEKMAASRGSVSV